MENESPRPKRKYGRWLLLIWFAIGVVVVIYWPKLSKLLENFGDWIQANPLQGAFAYIVVYILFCIFLIPSMALSLMVGPAFGFQIGLLVTVIASNIGGTVAFLLGRTLLHKRVERWAQDKPRFSLINEAVSRRAIPIVALLRMSPIFPFTILNYLLSLTRIPYWKFAVGTFIGMLPLNAAFVYIGCEAKEAAKTLSEAATKEVDFYRFVMRIVGIVATIIALAVISRIAVRAVRSVSAVGKATDELASSSSQDAGAGA